LDERDIDQFPKIIQRERKRRGLPALSDDDLAAEIEKSARKTINIDNPQILMERSYDFSYVRHAMVKICYQLAFLWLGEDYLDDPSAAELRAAICSPDADSTDRLPADVSDAENCQAFKLWASDKTHHLAYAFACEQGIAIVVRVFDIHAGVVWVTKDASRYLAGSDADAKLRFLSIEPCSGTLYETSMNCEMRRIASTLTARRRSQIMSVDA
jgi:hypothetical protein